MGQCTSNKAKAGNVSVKKILFHRKIDKKMNNKPNKQHKKFKDHKEDDGKMYPMLETDTLLEPNRKPLERHTKGVAMSFGFKRRPTSKTTNNGSVAWDPGPIRPDSNGNKNETIRPSSVPRQIFTKEKITHKSMPSRKQIHSATPMTTRISFPLNTSTDYQRTNQVADLKTCSFSFPLQFGAQSSKEINTSISPNAEPNRPFIRNVTIVTKTGIIDKTEVTRNRNENNGELGAGRGIQPGKFKFQTTRLPQPEQIRVIEAKTAKTIENNNRRSARLWRQYEEASLNVGISQADSGFGSNASGRLDRKSDDDSAQARLQNNRRFSLLENCNTLRDSCTPSPLPELPPVFAFDEHLDTNEENEWKTNNGKNRLLNLSGNPDAILKTRHFLDRDSSQSSSDQEWVSGGEAMADDVSLNSYRINNQMPTKKSACSESGTVAEAVMQALKPCASLEMIDSFKRSMNLTFSEEDPNFTAVATISNNNAAMLDDEMLSPVESLLSSSETEEMVKKKQTHQSFCSSKHLNEEFTPSSPGTPGNSFSLYKEDFLIDDEIADQPELVFETGNNADILIRPQFLHNAMEKPINQKHTTYKSDFSLLPLRKGQDYLTKRTNQGSFDSLSPCESLASEDLMMDYDVISQTNDNDVWDSLTSKPSTLNGMKGTSAHNFVKIGATRRSFHNCSSPKRNQFNPFGYQSMPYDRTSEPLMLNRTNHSAVQQDIIGIKTMLLTLKRVLNESESHNPLKNSTEEVFEDGPDDNDYKNEFALELDDLRRQVIFLQGQLEDKEKTVSNLQKQIADLAIENIEMSIDKARVLPVDNQGRCNAATQTERGRPLFFGFHSPSSTTIEDSNTIHRLIVKSA